MNTIDYRDLERATRALQKADLIDGCNMELDERLKARYPGLTIVELVSCNITDTEITHMSAYAVY